MIPAAVPPGPCMAMLPGTTVLCDLRAGHAGGHESGKTAWTDGEGHPMTRGDWMQTYTGRRFYPLAPFSEDVHPADIAHALSLLCRYGGHVERFYSVAEHCVLMSHAVPPEDALWALLHDATEAYVVDVPRPLKRSLPDYRAIENRVMVAIVVRFSLESLAMPDSVHDADNRILLDETAALMPNREPWQVDELEPLGVSIAGWAPAEAERRYLGRLAELTIREAATL